MTDAPWSERLSPLDAMFLDLEGPGAHMHVGGVLVLEGEPPGDAALLRHLAVRLDAVPRYRQRLAPVPLGLGRPVWVDDEAFELRDHVRRTTLAAPGGERALAAHAARFFASPLDRARPLWALEVVEGIGGGRFALLSKTHHCLLDGIAGVDFLQAISDAGPGPAPETGGGAPAPRSRWRPRPAPGRAEILAAALAERVARPLRLAREALAEGTEGRRFLLELAAGARPLAELATAWPVPRTPLEARVGPGRAWRTASIELAEVKAIRAALGGTVNDVLLAAVGGAIRALLAARGEALPEEIRVFVPVNVRPPDARGAWGNRVALVFVPVPVAEPSPAARLRRVTAATRLLKERRQAAGIVAFERLGELVPALVAGEAVRLALAMRFFNLVVSNVPGPVERRFLLGREIVACHPAIPLAAGQGLSVGFLSYAGRIGVGLLAGEEGAADVARLAAELPAAIDALRAAAGAEAA